MKNRIVFIILLITPAPSSIPKVWIMTQPESSYIVDLLPADIEYGEASYYADKFIGNTTASGERYLPYKLTAAHRSRPFGEMVKVCRQNRPKRCVIVQINDRGPFVRGRIIDLSHSAAKKIGLRKRGLDNVMLHKVNAQ